MIPTGADVLALATADLNSDGFADIVYIEGARYGNLSLHVLLGAGNKTFSHIQDITLPAGVCCSITITDVTGDGKLDLVLAGNRQSTAMIVAMVGQGDGTFGVPNVSTYTELGGNYAVISPVIAVGDVNEDGKADLVVNDDSTVRVFLGDGKGYFTPGFSSRTYLLNSVYLWDLNGDHHLDLVVTGLMGATFGVMPGNGDGTFQPGLQYSSQASTSAFYFLDLNGDGHPDMVTQYYPGNLGVFLGNADGTFAPMSALSASLPGQLLGVPDVNGDGVPDLLYFSSPGLGVKLGQTALAFGAANVVSASPAVNNVPPVLADFNSDEHPDIALAVEGGIVILPGKGDGTFAGVDYYEIGEQVGNIAVADFTGDKKVDIVVSLPAAYPRLLVGDGAGNFALGPDPNSSHPLTKPYPNLAVGDFNGDGKLDLSLGDLTMGSYVSGSQSIEFGTGSGTFLPVSSVANAGPIVADINHDGRSDTLFISGSTVTVNLGQANQTFTSVVTTLRNPAYQSYALGDLNGDGRPDLVLEYGDHFEIWTGKGDGTFSCASMVNHGSALGSILAVQDIDGDEKADIVFAPLQTIYSTSRLMQVFYGNGDGTLAAPVSIPARFPYKQLAVSDVDLDGRQDLVLTDGNVIAVKRNLGARRFDSEVFYVAGLNITGLTAADVNGDGYPDIIVANAEATNVSPYIPGSSVTVLLNQPNGIPPTGPQVNGTLTASPEPSISGDQFTVTLALTPAQGQPTPTGTVAFNIDGALVATSLLVDGVASFSTTGTVTPFPNFITATYGGDNTYGPRVFDEEHTIQPRSYPTHTALTVSPMTVLTSQTVQLRATVTSAEAVNQGVVTFRNGTSVIAAVNVDSSGQAVYDTAMLSSGTHSLTASYSGYSAYGYDVSTLYTTSILDPSTSSPVTLIVGDDSTTTSLTASSTTITAGQVLTLTATVTSPAGIPSGGATFYDGSNALGTMALSSGGTVTFSTAGLSIGNHSITVSFNANGVFGTSNSLPVSVAVSAAPTHSVVTAVSISAESVSGNGDAVFSVDVISPRGVVVGKVTVIDAGRIVATTNTDFTGHATVPASRLLVGSDQLTASFDGNSALAPSVSPKANEVWPSSGPGFDLHLGSPRLRVSSANSGNVKLEVIPSPGFSQRVELSCTAGLPDDYECSFSPQALQGGGESTLNIHKRQSASATSLQVAVHCTFAFGFVCCAVLLCSRDRRIVGLAIMLFLLSLASCGVPAKNTARMTVVSLQAQSGTGDSTIIHSAQVCLILPAE